MRKFLQKYIKIFKDDPKKIARIFAEDKKSLGNFLKKDFKKAMSFFWRCCKKRNLRIAFYIFLGTFVGINAIEYTNKYAEETFFVQKGSIVHVDQHAKTGKENGSSFYPFKEINSAIEFIESYPEINTIFVYDGKYEEQLELPYGINLYGTGDDVVLQSTQPKSGKTLVLSGNNVVFNMKVEKGRYAVYILSDARVSFVKSRASDAHRYGIYNEKYDRENDKIDIAIIESEVNHNRLQGMYLQKSNVLINNSNVHDNGEEGVDLHFGMNTHIQNTIIENNGEGGIETELADNTMTFIGNTIRGNGSSGINLQSMARNATAYIENNTIGENTDFGIRCAIHKGFGRDYFNSMITISKTNKFEINGKVDVDTNCNL